MTTPADFPDLPPFPEIPLSPESRLRWLAWGRECMAIERERCAKICDRINSDSGNGFEPFAEAIRSELPRNQEG